MQSRRSFLCFFFFLGSGLFFQASGLRFLSSFHWWKSKQWPIWRMALASGAWSFTGTFASPVFTSNFTQLPCRMCLLLSVTRTYLYPLIPWYCSLVPGGAASARYNCPRIHYASRSCPSSSSSYSGGGGWEGGGGGGAGLEPPCTKLEGKKPLVSLSLRQCPYHHPFSKTCSTYTFSPFLKDMYLTSSFSSPFAYYWSLCCFSSSLKAFSWEGDLTLLRVFESSSSSACFSLSLCSLLGQRGSSSDGGGGGATTRGLKSKRASARNISYS